MPGKPTKALATGVWKLLKRYPIQLLSITILFAYHFWCSYKSLISSSIDKSYHSILMETVFGVNCVPQQCLCILTFIYEWYQYFTLNFLILHYFSKVCFFFQFHTTCVYDYILVYLSLLYILLFISNSIFTNKNFCSWAGQIRTEMTVTDWPMHAR